MGAATDTVLDLYERYHELVYKYIVWTDPQMDEQRQFQIMKCIWQEAAERKDEWKGKTERERGCMVLALAMQIMKKEK